MPCPPRLRGSLVLVAAFVGSIALPGACHAALPFVNELVDSLGNVGCYTDIEIDAEGNPHAIYIDLINLSVRYAVRRGGVWKTELVDTVFGCTSLALDSRGNPHVSYDDSDTQSLRYATKVGGSWYVQTVIGSNVAHETAIAVDANDEPHIVYQTVSTIDVRWVRRVFGGWQDELVDGTGSAGYSVAIGVTGTGTPRIAYSRSVGAQDRLLYAERLGGSWVIQQVDSLPTSGVGGYCMMALDSRSEPHISHYAAGAQQLRYTRRSGSSWSSEVVSTAGGNYTSIALDPHDVPHVSFQIGFPNYDLGYAGRSGGTWQVQTVDAPGQVGYETGIAVDRQGGVHICQYDATNGDFKYATSSIYLKSPLGGERWPSGTPQTVRWGGAGVVDVLLSVDGGLTHDTIASGVGGGSVTVTAPALSTDRARIRITRAEPFATADSPGDFEIAPNLVSPWYTHTIDPNQAGTFASLALSAQNNPSVSYYGAGDLRYATRIGGAWQIETADAPNTVGQWTSLAVDAQGNPSIAYYDVTNQDLRFASRAGGIWSSMKVDSTGSVGKYAAMALDAGGVPHIAYSDVTNGNLKYATRVGSTWVLESPDTAGAVGTHTSLAIDGTGSPHIAYYDNGNANLKYAYQFFGEWYYEDLDVVGSVGQYTSIRIDREGNPHISYIDVTSGHRMLKYAVRRAGIWTFEPVDVSSTSVATYTSLGLDESGNPTIAYYLDSTLRIATRIGGLWKVEVVVDDGISGTHPSVALDAQGRIHLTYYDTLGADLEYRSTAVAISAPKPGETWPVGASRNVTWDGTGQVDLWLSTDGGAAYELLASGLTRGSHRLTVPYTPSKFCKLKLERRIPHSVAITDSFFRIETSVALLSFAVRSAPPGETGVVLSWSTSPGIEDLAGYQVERSEGGGTWRELVSLTRETSYRDTDGGPAMRYRLSALNILGQRVPLGEAELGTPGPLAAWPLPYRGGALRMTFATFGGLGGGKGPAELALYDVLGRLVRVMARGDFPAGAHTVVWDGRDGEGRTVGAGLYFLRSRSAGRDQRLKVVVAP